MNGIIYITAEEHSGHPLNIEHTHTKPPVIREDDDTGAGGIVLPLAVAQEAKVTCVVCGVRLIEGEDYVVQEDEVEPWRT